MLTSPHRMNSRCFFSAHQVRVEVVEEAELGLLPLLARGAAGKVAADDRELALRRVEAQFQVAAFGVELRAAEADDHVAGLVPGVNRHARIALLLGEVEVALEAGQLLEAALRRPRAWALTSCTQIQSGLVSATQASTPLVAAERMPLRLRLVSLNKEFPMAGE